MSWVDGPRCPTCDAPGEWCAWGKAYANASQGRRSLTVMFIWLTLPIGVAYYCALEPFVRLRNWWHAA